VTVDPQISANGTAHHTSDFSSGLVVRRGAVIDLRAKLELDAGDAPAFRGPWRATATATSGAARTAFSCPELPSTAMDPHGETASWGVVPRDGGVWLCTPPNAPIGRYELVLEAGGVAAPPLHAIILFNPWCVSDAVSLPDEAARHEYVLREDGTLYTGSAFYVRKKAWTYDQFDPDIVDAVLDRFLSSMSVDELADPVRLSRRMSAWVNSNDENGLMIGNWSGSYKPFVAPSKWTGSLPIFRAWLNGGPVKWGQCFTFAATLTTVMRLLGVPCRPVSNYWSAHDTGYDRVIDKFFDADGKKLGHDTHDSIWTFHVWNDVWMRRADLGKYDGWQAIDATPQELSDGLWQCGPAPVVAVFEGNGQPPHDTEFVIGEVNADEYTWTRGADGVDTLSKVDKDKIGPFLLTQSIGSTDGATLKLDGNMSNGKLTDTENVMNLYKPKEGNKLAERATLQNARVQGGPVTFSAHSVNAEGHPTTHISLGEPITLVATAEGGEADWRLEIYASAYTGRAGELLAHSTSSGETATLTLSADQYRAVLGDTACAFECRAFAAAGEQHFAAVLQRDLAVPELELLRGDSGGATGVHTLTVGFSNPCAFDLGAASLTASATRGVRVVVSKGDGQLVPANATVEFELTITPTRSREAAYAAIVALELDTEVLADVPGGFRLEVPSGESGDIAARPM